jgi:hypothetical protein
MERIVHGAVAGAVGTVALNATTYLDMLVRGRPASELPAEATADLAAEAGVDLRGPDPADANRREAMGALAGMATGIGIGAVCSLVAPRLGRRRLWLPSAVVGGLAMAAVDVPLVARGLTDPRRWGAAGWAADIVPHLAYGVGVVSALRAIRRDPWRVTGEVVALVPGDRSLVVQ